MPRLTGNWLPKYAKPTVRLSAHCIAEKRLPESAFVSKHADVGAVLLHSVRTEAIDDALPGIVDEGAF